MPGLAEPKELLLRLLDPAHRADPYPLYSEIRERGPIVIPEANFAVFGTYAQCDEIFRHPASGNDRLKSSVAQKAVAEGQPARPFGQPGFLFLDPPDHTRLRKLAQKAFAPRVVKALEPEIVALVDQLLANLKPDSEFDAIAGLAYPLPVAVICRLLGVPLSDEPKFSAAPVCWRRAWTRSSRSPARCPTPSPTGSRPATGCAVTCGIWWGSAAPTPAKI